MNPTPPQFTVQLIGQASADLVRLSTRAKQPPLLELYLDLLRQILESLEADPRSWGDPYTNFRGMNAVAYERTVLPANVRVKYTVHDTEPLVWVSSVRPLPGSPFA